MSLHELFPIKRICGALLYEEIIPVVGVVYVFPALEALDPARSVDGTLTNVKFEVDDALDAAPVVEQVELVIEAHVADPAIGPVGMSSQEITQAWSDLGRQMSEIDTKMNNWSRDAPTLEADFGAWIAGWGDPSTEESIVTHIMWLSYYTARRVFLVQPADYDPFNEGTVLVDPDSGTLVWTPSGPPW